MIASQIQNQPCTAHGAARKPLIAALALALAWAAPAARPQTTLPSHSTAGGASTAAGAGAIAAYEPPVDGAGRNTYGDVLKPTVKRPEGRQHELYQPIQQQDDAGQVQEIEMFVGESRVFPAPGVARIAVGNGQIMSAAALDDKEVIVFANGAGTSSLFVWNADGRHQRVKVNIVAGDTSRVAREVAAFLATIPNARASIVGDKVIVEGDTLSDEDRDKVGELAKRYQQIVNFTSPIGWEKMVMMDVKVVEFPKTELRELGLQWSATGGAAIGGIWKPLRYGRDGPYQIDIPGNGTKLPITDLPAAGGQALETATLPSALNLIGAANMGISAKLNLLQQNGSATVLAEPQLSARSGYKASFLAGGEFPYSVSNANGVTIIFKPYGIRLEIEPRIGRNGVIRAVIDSEVSSIDASVTATAGPALLSRKTKTEFNVKNGETMVLSGLLQRNTSNDIDKVPMLGDIPILGSLFRSKRFQNKETELVVFVTPTIVDSRSGGLVDRVERATERLTENLGRSPYLSAPLQPGRDAAKFDQGAVGSDTPAAAPAVLPAPAPAPVRPRRTPSGSGLGGSSLEVVRDGLLLHAEPNAASVVLLELGAHSVVLLGPAAAPAPQLGLWRNVVVGSLNGWVRADGVQPSRLRPRFHSASGPAAQRGDPDPRAVRAAVAAGAARRPVTADVVVDESPSEWPARYRVAFKGLPLKLSPDINAPAIHFLDAGQLVVALPQRSSGNWIAVQAGSARGWVAGQWLQAAAAQD